MEGPVFVPVNVPVFVPVSVRPGTPFPVGEVDQPPVWSSLPSNYCCIRSSFLSRRVSRHVSRASVPACAPASGTSQNKRAVQNIAIAHAH